MATKNHDEEMKNHPLDISKTATRGVSLSHRQRFSAWIGKQGRRKIVRVIAIFVNPILAYLIYFAVAEALYLSTLNTFDPRSAINIQVTACSVFAKPCPLSGTDEFGDSVCGYDAEIGQKAGTIRVQRNMIKSSSSRTFRTSTSYLEYLTVSSTLDCLAFQSRYCAPVCRVDVYIPAENSLHLKITQEKSEASKIATLRLEPGVSLDQLTVSGTSLRVSVEGSSVSTKAKITSGSEEILILDSRLTDGWLSADDSNIRVIYRKNQTYAAPPDLIKVDYRSTTYDDRVALSAKKVYFQNENTTMDECTSGKYLQRIQKAYDLDNNGKVTSDEFTSGLATIGKCCGSACPVANYCDTKLTPVYIPYGASYITSSQLYETIRDELDYSVIPWCTRRAWLDTNSSHDLSDEELIAVLEENVDYINARTNAGMIQIGFWDADGFQPFVSEAQEDADAVAEENDGEYDSIDLRMLSSMANSIFSSVRDIYGDGPVAESSDIPTEVFAVFFADISPFLNEFSSTTEFRFVYTNQPVYLSIAPSLLSALSLGLLQPDIKHFRISFAPSSPYQLGNASATREAMGNELFRILKPRFRTSLWGAMVSLDDDEGGFQRPSYSQYTLDPASEEVIQIDFSPDQLGTLSLLFSLLIGVITAVMVLSKFSTIMKLHLQNKFRNDDARAKVLKARKRTTVREAFHVDFCKDDDRYAMNNVLERPVELFDVILVDPVRRYLSDSLRSFINQTYEIDEKHLVWNKKHGPRQLKHSHKSRMVAPQETSRLTVSLPGRGSQVVPVDKAKISSKRVSHAAHSSGRYENSMTLSRFLKAYEKFCFQENLNMEENIQTVKQRLLTEFGIRIRSFMALRVAGCRWKEIPAHHQDGLYTKEIRRSAPNYNYSQYVHAHWDKLSKISSTEDMLEHFVLLFCDVTGNVADFVSFENLLDQKTGVERKGFQDAFQSFARTIQRRSGYGDVYEVALDADMLDKVNLKLKTVRIETMRALKTPLDTNEHVRRFSWRWYAVQYVEAWIHQLAFAVGPAMLMQLAFSAQAMHATTIGSAASLHKEDLALLPVKRNLASFDVIWLLQGAGSLAAICLLTCYVLLFLVYVEIFTLHVLIQRIIRISYRVVFTCSLFVLLCFISMQCVWVLLAAFLRPASFLPMGSALACFLSILTYQYNRIHKIKSRVQGTMVEVFNSKIRDRILEAIDLKRQCAQTLNPAILSIASDTNYTFDPNDLFTLIDAPDVNYKNIKVDSPRGIGTIVSPIVVPAAKVVDITPNSTEVDTHIKSDDTEIGVLSESPRDSAMAVTAPTEIITNSSGGNELLSREEFDQMFDMLGINVLQSRRDMMFAYCDLIESDDYVSREEFLGAWDWLLGELASSVVGQGLGLSSIEITLYMVTLAVVLALIFVFLLLSMAAFNPNGGFSAIVQSAIIASASFFSTSASNAFGAAGAATDLHGNPEEVKKIVSKEVDEHIVPETESN